MRVRVRVRVPVRMLPWPRVCSVAACVCCVVASCVRMCLCVSVCVLSVLSCVCGGWGGVLSMLSVCVRVCVQSYLRTCAWSIVPTCDCLCVRFRVVVFGFVDPTLLPLLRDSLEMEPVTCDLIREKKSVSGRGQVHDGADGSGSGSGGDLASDGNVVGAFADGEMGDVWPLPSVDPVSYTHLTLPTIYSV